MQVHTNPYNCKNKNKTKKTTKKNKKTSDSNKVTNVGFQSMPYNQKGAISY